MKLLFIFIILSIVNVIFATVRTLTTVKSGKGIASIISGGYFAFYNIVLVYTVMNFPLWQKCLITGVCNIIGVYIVKLLEEKSEKTKIWKFEFTAHQDKITDIEQFLINANISYNTVKANSDKTIFYCYCNTKENSSAVMELLKQFKVKYIINVNRE